MIEEINYTNLVLDESEVCLLEVLLLASVNESKKKIKDLQKEDEEKLFIEQRHIEECMKIFNYISYSKRVKN